MVLVSSILVFLTCPSSSSLSLTDKISQTLLDASKTLQEEPSQISRFLLSYPLSYPCQNSGIWFFLPNLPHLSSVTDLSFQSWDIPNMLQHLFRNLVFGEKTTTKNKVFPTLTHRAPWPSQFLTNPLSLMSSVTLGPFFNLVLRLRNMCTAWWSWSLNQLPATTGPRWAQPPE